MSGYLQYSNYGEDETPPLKPAQPMKPAQPAQHTQHTFFMEQKKGGMHWRNSFSKAHEVEMGGGLSS